MSSHEIWDIVRDLASGAILLLLGIIFNRWFRRHDAERKAAENWRAGVDKSIAELERRRHARDGKTRQANGVDSDDEPDAGPHSGRGPRIRKP